ncbi:hypothetical protein O181_035194 [Austropuccinia psidii MF-1]|uniref:Large ribosomal subunit protein uL4m n=1 Tax=Austropuccinia psidii MF-1 TaxID=1389203 RepID=A0A9Q3D299_9BASI|nr:hypothetical protein [Austropuccinia psidii MF-1]
MTPEFRPGLRSAGRWTSSAEKTCERIFSKKEMASISFGLKSRTLAQHFQHHHPIISPSPSSPSRSVLRHGNAHFCRIFSVCSSQKAETSLKPNNNKTDNVNSTRKKLKIYQKPIEGITHGDSIQHVVLNKFKINQPDEKNFENNLVLPISKFVFDQGYRQDILHRCVVFERSLMRSGSANTKTRSEVAMSGKKLRPQKGTGRARLGDASSPTLRKGGVAFGPKPKDWAQGLQRKVWELGLRIVLSQRWRDGRLIVVDQFDMDGRHEASQQLANLLKSRGWTSAVLIAGGNWGSQSEGWKSPGLLREALSRSHLITDGIRLGQTGSLWQDLQRAKILPVLNSIDLAHPADLRPGKPHPCDSKPPAIGIYHLLLRKYIILDLAALQHLEHNLTRDLRRPITALGLSPTEAYYQQQLASKSLSYPMSSLIK